MNNTNPLPDYYAILPVHPSAEPEIIEATYRRLMRKYHPDVLSPELRSDPDILSRVRAINVAYDVLSDPTQRAAYDSIFAQQKAEPVVPINPEIETAVLVVRCARTKQRFRMLVGRLGVSRKYRVLGFEPVDPSIPALAESPELPRLPASSQPANLFKKLFGRRAPIKNDQSKVTSETPRFPSTAQINQLFDNSTDINFFDIIFAGQNCPACNHSHVFPDGASVNWLRCNICGRIYCTGAIQSTKLGDLTRCPWCRTPGRIIRHKLGDQDSLPVKSETGNPRNTRSVPPQLKDTKHKALPDK